MLCGHMHPVGRLFLQSSVQARPRSRHPTGERMPRAVESKEWCREENHRKGLQRLARIIHIFEDNKGLLCYKHVVKTMFAATKGASECLKITQHSVCCSQRFFASLS